MKAERYFKKNGKIYGVSSKFDFGTWNHTVYAFDDLETAEEWLENEEYDFRERELTSRSRAIKLAGKKSVEEAQLLKAM